jgi:protein subunit release factor A
MPHSETQKVIDDIFTEAKEVLVPPDLADEGSAIVEIRAGQ